MKERKHSFRSAFLTGLITLLPLGILIIVILWVYRIIETLLAPILNLVGLGNQFYIVVVGLVVLVLLIALIGLAVRTQIGRTLFYWFEEGVLAFIPGYRNVRKFTSYFTGKAAKEMYRSAALVDIFQNGTFMTGFIIEKSSDEYLTLFIPTGPNPTSGLIYHVKKKFVIPVNVSVDKALESVIAVGKNSHLLFEKMPTASKRKVKRRKSKTTS